MISLLIVRLIGGEKNYFAFESNNNMKILLVGEKERADELRVRLSLNQALKIDFSDGDEEEDFKDYEVIFDLNFDDDPSNAATYYSLKETPVFLSAVKLRLAEAVYAADTKVK